MLVSSVTVIAVAIVVFATTNIDDILLLSAFFADRTLRPRSIVIGQFAGIGVLTLVSAVAAVLALAIPDGWIALLGLAPLALGVRGIHRLWQSRHSNAADVPDVTATGHRAMRWQWMTVAAVTMANGGDNLGVYVPLFSRELSHVTVYAAVFAVMTALWCAAGYWLVNHPLLGGRIRTYGSVALPFVLLGLGLHILADARALIR